MFFCFPESYFFFHGRSTQSPLFGFGGYDVLVCSGLPVCCCLLPCAVSGGSAASRAVSLNSAHIAAGVVDPLGLSFYLCSDWSWAGCSHIHWPVPNLLPVLSRVAAPQSPLASVNKSCNGAKPRTLVVQSRNAVAAMPKCCLPCNGKVWVSTLTARCPDQV